jgi:regulatory protein
VVLTALERRRRTRRDLEAILSRKGFGPQVAAQVLDRLTEVGLIDDLEYARVYLERRAGSRPRGARFLKAELLAKGVPPEAAEQALGERVAAVDPVDEAMRALNPWLLRNRGIGVAEERRKIWQILARWGFSAETIENVLLRLNRRAGDDLDEP